LRTPCRRLAADERYGILATLECAVHGSLRWLEINT
jgi:hypothetical protein